MKITAMRNDASDIIETTYEGKIEIGSMQAWHYSWAVG